MTTHRPRPNHPGNPTIHVIARADAVHTIAGHLADRDAFVLLVPLGMTPTVAHRLADLATTPPRTGQAGRACWTGYLA
jgi:hypothetical protein